MSGSTTTAFGLAAFWWFGAGVLLAAELASGTFYLLMLAVGLVAAAIAAHIGVGLSAQIVTAALLGGTAVAALYAWRRNRPHEAPARSNPDAHLDIGNTVHVSHWDARGGTQISYRGAHWDARYEGADPPAPGQFVIRALDGNVLILGR